MPRGNGRPISSDELLRMFESAPEMAPPPDPVVRRRRNMLDEERTAASIPLPPIVGAPAPQQPDPMAGQQSMLLDRVIEARRAAAGAKERGASVGGMPTGVDDVPGFDRARYDQSQHEASAMQDTALIDRLMQLPMRPGTSGMIREMGDPTQALAMKDLLASRGYNAGYDARGGLSFSMSEPPAPAAPQQPMLPPPGMGRGGMKLGDQTLQLTRLGKMIEDGVGGPQGTAWAQQQIEQILAGGGMPGHGGGGQGPLDRFSQGLGGWESALGIAPQGGGDQQVYDRLHKAFIKRHRRQPTERELYKAYANLHGMAGGRR